MKKYIIGNWKMNLNVHESSLFVAKLAETLKVHRDVETVICPSFLALEPVSLQIDHRQMKLGAQNCYWRDEGAFTGEVSAAQLKGLAQYVIIGHSERRHIFDEDDRDIRFKVQAAIRNGIRPVLCIGETLEDKERGDTEGVLCDQLASGLMNVDSGDLNDVVVAYEPVWAIGSSAPAGVDDIAASIRTIRTQVCRMFGVNAAADVPVLYGGSCDTSNAGDILREADVDGLLVGRASLIASEFSGLVELGAKVNSEERAAKN